MDLNVALGIEKLPIFSWLVSRSQLLRIVPLTSQPSTTAGPEEWYCYYSEMQDITGSIVRLDQ